MKGKLFANHQKLKGLGCTSVIENAFSIHEVLGSAPSPPNQEHEQIIIVSFPPSSGMVTTAGT